MKQDSLNLLAEIDSMSKIHALHRGDIDKIMIEFAQRILTIFRIERMAVWLFNPEKDAIVSIGEYNLTTRNFTKGSSLPREKYLRYFKAIDENEILLAENIYANPNTAELSFDYSEPNDIISLMDIPLRIEGELIGVMCFEKTGTVERVFTEKEQYFAMSVGVILASSLEARHRRALQVRLNEELKEKETLLKEIHHRVKNNLTVVSSLLSLQSHKSKDDFHRNLFDECRHKVNTISGIHELIYKSETLSEINAKEYFSKLIHDLHEFYRTDSIKVELVAQIDDVSVDLNYALPMALIANEVVTNCYKHAFGSRIEGKIWFSIESKGARITMSVKDDGVGFDWDEPKSDSLGIEIIKGLADQIDADYSFVVDGGTAFSLSFELVAEDDSVD